MNLQNKMPTGMKHDNTTFISKTAETYLLSKDNNKLINGINVILRKLYTTNNQLTQSDIN